MQRDPKFFDGGWIFQKSHKIILISPFLLKKTFSLFPSLVVTMIATNTKTIAEDIKPSLNSVRTKIEHKSIA